MFDDMDQTQCPMLLYFLLYGCTWEKKFIFIFCSRGSGYYGRHGSANTALFKGACTWEKSEGPNWGGKVLLQRLSAAVQRGNAISIMSGLLEGARDTIT